MKKTIILILALLLSIPAAAVAKSTRVKGYYRKDGTYVKPHTRSSPSKSKSSTSQPSSSYKTKDVRVKGYYRKDGTYVRPHIRTAPDQYKWNNYGPSKSSDQLMNPRLRDSDNDGIPNYLDTDDDNDGIHDDHDKSQY